MPPRAGGVVHAHCSLFVVHCSDTNLPHHAPPRQAGIFRTMKICWTPSRPMFTGLHSEMRQTTLEIVRFSKPPIPRSRIPNPGMAYGIGHPMSHPREDRTSSVRWVSWRTGTGRKGRKRDNLEPWTGPLETKNPAGRTIRGVTKSFLGYRRTMLASAESSIKRKQRKQRARNPMARSRGFTVKHGQRFRREGSPWRIDGSKDCDQAGNRSPLRSLPG